MQQSKNIYRDVWCVLGLPFDAISLQESVDYLGGVINTTEKCFLSTPNLNFAIATQSDAVFFQSVVESDLSVADGMPLIWVAKMLGIPLTERVAGSTLFDELSHKKDKVEKIKVFFFGGQNGVAKQAHQNLNDNSPAMISCGFHDPGFVSVADMSKPKIIRHINSCNPDFIVVALGARKGQQWIQLNKSKLKAPVISHLGAVINFVAGNIDRAPIAWQRFGVEWLWRIRQEPALWKRYLFDGFAFIRLMIFNVLPLAIYDRLLKKMASYNKPYEVEFAREDKVYIRLTGSIHHQVIGQFKHALDTVIEEYQEDVVIDCNQLAYIDSAFIATVLLFQCYLNEKGRNLVLINMPSRIIKILRLSSVIRRFTLL